MTALPRAMTTEPTLVVPMPAAVKPSADGRRNLFGMDRVQLRDAFESMGEKPFRADQVMQWIYRRGVGDFEAMSNLSKPLRQRLTEHFVVGTPTPWPSKNQRMERASGG